jgi:hypothetical protein
MSDETSTLGADFRSGATVAGGAAAQVGQRAPGPVLAQGAADRIWHVQSAAASPARAQLDPRIGDFPRADVLIEDGKIRRCGRSFH